MHAPLSGTKNFICFHSVILINEILTGVFYLLLYINVKNKFKKIKNIILIYFSILNTILICKIK
jgi:hypothetical protein